MAMLKVEVSHNHPVLKVFVKVLRDVTEASKRNGEQTLLIQLYITCFKGDFCELATTVLPIDTSLCMLLF